MDFLKSVLPLADLCNLGFQLLELLFNGQLTHVTSKIEHLILVVAFEVKEELVILE